VSTNPFFIIAFAHARLPCHASQVSSTICRHAGIKTAARYQGERREPGTNGGARDTRAVKALKRRHVGAFVCALAALKRQVAPAAETRGPDPWDAPQGSSFDFRPSCCETLPCRAVPERRGPAVRFIRLLWLALLLLATSAAAQPTSYWHPRNSWTSFSISPAAMSRVIGPAS
jgi:hypothetical protein